jgi:cytochrome c biogenesis protein
MSLLKIQNSLKLLTDLKFAILVLGMIAILSSVGSFIEQDEASAFYQENYTIENPIYGFISWKLILQLGLDHIYTTWWFLTLLIILGFSLIGCTITRQFPLVERSKEYFFKTKKKSFIELPFFVRFKNIYYLKELILLKLQKMNFYLYQRKNLIYGYKGLIGRISPILVHISLILILIGSSFGAFENFKAQEILPKGEVFHIQNTIQLGKITKIPNLIVRVNEFWVEYKSNRIRQFYSNLSILNNEGQEIKQKTISVNNPLRYKNVDFYQSDWSLIGIRVQKLNENKIYEFPLFKLNSNSKSWITWLNENNKSYSLVFDSFDNNYLLYDDKGAILGNKNLNDHVDNNWKVIDIISSTGLLVKYDPSIPVIYAGFALLMLTTLLSYLPYTQIWIYQEQKLAWIGCLTNRGKLSLEIEFENLIRYIENNLIKNKFSKID